MIQAAWVAVAAPAEVGEDGSFANPFSDARPSPPTLPFPSAVEPLVTIGSFAEVDAAIATDRIRRTAIEERIARLEAASATETLPLPPAAEKAASAPKPPEPYEVGSDTTMAGRWNYGFEAQSKQRDFRVKVGGRIQVDEVAFTQGPGPALDPKSGGLAPPLNNAVDIRRARLRVDGRMYELYDFVSEFDFANQLNSNSQANPTEASVGNYVSVNDNWIQLREFAGDGILRAGVQKDPFGFEHIASSRWLNFMERSYGQDLYSGPFNGGFVPGVRYLGRSEDERVTWSAGGFKNTVNPFGFIDNSSGNAAVGRLTWLPFWEDDGAKMLHLGIAGRAQQTNNGFARYRARGALRNGPSGPLNSIYVDSGQLQANWQNELGLELVGNNGPWSFQSEYFCGWLYDTVTTTSAFNPKSLNYGQAGLQPNGAFAGTYFTQSAYTEVLYFVTGETRAYDRVEARFDRPIPRNNFYVVRGADGDWQSSSGAVQVGMRYQYACLDDHMIHGGVLNGLTLGVNWIFSGNARLYFNYDFAYRNFVNNFNNYASGWITGFGTRLALDF